MNYKGISNDWRKVNTKYANSGIVLIWGGNVYGWKDSLREPKCERPGVIAVDTDGNVFVAKGGNDDDGAKCWVVLV